MKFLLVLLISLVLLTGPADARSHGGAPISSNLGPINGVNLSGLEDGDVYPGIPGTDYLVPCNSTYDTQAECPYYALRGVKEVRLPIIWERIQPTLGGALDPTYLGLIENVLTQGAANGFVVKVDLHNFGGAFGGKVGGPGGPTYAQFANLWRLIAQNLNGYSALEGYDLMNEPSNMPSHVNVPAMYQAAINAIRVVDTSHIIFLEGDGYATAWGWTGTCPTTICGGAPADGWAAGNSDDLLSIVDPEKLITFEAHVYGDYNGSGTFPTYPQPAAVGCTSGQTTYQCAEAMMDQLTDPYSTLDTNILIKRSTPFVNWCNTRTTYQKCSIGEDGFPYDDPAWLVAGDLLYSYLAQNHVSFNYWDIGPDAQSAYILGMEPANLGKSNQEDAVQMALFTKHSGGMAPASYFLTGPNRGATSTPSAPFTVTYRGYITVPITFTPNDNSAGGTFTPPSVTCGPGFNCVQTFTYTAPATDAYEISITNGHGFTNPPSLGYATVPDLFSTNSISDAQIENVVSIARKVYAPYIGPAVNLRKVVGGITTISDFNYTSLHLYAPLDTASIQAWNGASETDTLASTTVTVSGAANFGTDSGAVYTSSGTPLVWIPAATPSGGTAVAPLQGQYQLTGGVYTFNSADVGQSVTISYLFPTFLVTAYDQGPAAQPLGIANDEDTTPSLADQPLLQLACNNGPPCAVFSGTNRMDMVSPVTGNTGQTALNVVAPNYHLGGQFMGWDWNACPTPGVASCEYNMNDDIYAANDGWQVTNMTNGQVNSAANAGFQRMYSQDYTFAAMGDTFQASTVGGFRTFSNGELTGENDGGSALYLGFGRNDATFGYQRFLSPNWAGRLSETIVLNTAISNSAVQAFHSEQDSAYGIAYNGSYTPFTPTLDQEVSTENAPPWAGFNESGAIGNFGRTTNSVSSAAVRTQTCANFVTATAGQAYYANDVGSNLIRLPVQWECLQPNLAASNTSLDATNLAALDTIVSQITAAKLDTMVDIHNFGTYSYAGAATVGTGNGSTTSFSTTIASSRTSILPMTNCSAAGIGQVNYGDPTLTYTIGGITTVTSWTSNFFCNGANPRPFFDNTGNIATSSLNVTTGAFSITFNHAPDNGTPILVTWAASQNFTSSTYGTSSDYATFLGLLAAHYSGNPKVKFDLMNEPAGVAASIEVPVEQAAINAIRGAGNTSYIMAEFGPTDAACSDTVSAFFHGTVSGTTLTLTSLDGGFGSAGTTNGTISVGAGVSASGLPENTTILALLTGSGGVGSTYQLSNSAAISTSTAMASGNGGPAYNSLTDTSNKLSYECHQYLSSCGFDGCGDYAPKGSALSAFNGGVAIASGTGGTTKYCNLFGCKLLWGEFNDTFTQQMYAELKSAYDLFAANSGSYYGWTEFSGGPAWGESYIGLVEPREYPTPYARRGQLTIENIYATSHALGCNNYISGSSGPCLLSNWPYSTKFPQ